VDFNFNLIYGLKRRVSGNKIVDGYTRSIESYFLLLFVSCCVGAFVSFSVSDNFMFIRTLSNEVFAFANVVSDNTVAY